MSEWNESQHDRAADGTFREMVGSAPEGRLVLETAPAPAPDAYRTVATDGGSCTIDDDGFEQYCSCGNGSQSDWWAAGAANGKITMDAVSRAHDDDTIICPSCGRAYRHGDVDWGCSVEPVARFDVTDDTFAQALDQQHRMLFGSPRRPDDRAP